MLKLIECPRDAMQGLHEFIPTELKVNYLKALLEVGFDSLDCGSFVSWKAIPQMRDTAEVIQEISNIESNTKLLTIVANLRGAEEAMKFSGIQYLGFPFSISETFQLRNTNSTIQESVSRVGEIQQLCQTHNKALVVYISMGFGNPYGDHWSANVVEEWVDQLAGLGIRIFSLSDTVGVSSPDNIAYLFSHLIKKYPGLEIGAHLHTQTYNWEEKIHSAYTNGCRRFDSAMLGFGGCPMAKDELTGNMSTENVLKYLMDKCIDHGLELDKFAKAREIALNVFP